MPKKSNGIEARKTKLGKGVFALRPFRKGQVVAVMTGTVVPAGVPPFGYRQGKVTSIEAAFNDPYQIGPVQYMLLAEPFININHSCDPNLGIRGRGTLFALRSIRVGEELTFDYSTTMDELFLCRCGAKNCRGVPLTFSLFRKQCRRDTLDKEPFRALF